MALAQAVLLRQHLDRGIIASGTIETTPFREPHWDGSSGEANTVVIAWDTVLAPADRLRVEILHEAIPNVHWDRTQAGGVRVPDDTVRALAELWSAHTASLTIRSPEEPDPGISFPEGTLRRVELNRYERDPRARKIALAHWGCRCAVCDLDFSERYGELGQGFIHVHHLIELSQVGPDYQVDPVNHLRPVCPNCHAMLHRRQPTLPIDELKMLLTSRPIHEVTRPTNTDAVPS